MAILLIDKIITKNKMDFRKKKKNPDFPHMKCTNKENNLNFYSTYTQLAGNLEYSFYIQSIKTQGAVIKQVIRMGDYLPVI